MRSAPRRSRVSAYERRGFLHSRSVSEKKYGTAVGRRGGYAPDLASDEEAIQVIMTAIEKAAPAG